MYERWIKATEWENLPEKNAVRPDVTLHGVDPLEGAFGCHPLHWQPHLKEGGGHCESQEEDVLVVPLNASCSFTHISSHDVVGVVVDVPGKPKVTDFDQPTFRHQNVPGRQVSVDALWHADKAVDTSSVVGYWVWVT